MKNLAPNIVKLRICVAFMGEKEQIGWWQSRAPPQGLLFINE
jgi:hypothetical protein